jgi:hypothetical protein
MPDKEPYYSGVKAGMCIGGTLILLQYKYAYAKNRNVLDFGVGIWLNLKSK